MFTKGDRVSFRVRGTSVRDIGVVWAFHPGGPDQRDEDGDWFEDLATIGFENEDGIGTAVVDRDDVRKLVVS